MKECRAKLSEVRAQTMADTVARIATRMFADRAQRQAFVALVCIESRFASDAKSPVGAVGPAQVMPQYAAEFARECGLGAVAPGDVLDPTTNLQIGACRFRSLLQQFDGNVALALAGYNSGAASPTTKKLAGGGNGAAETSEYLSRHYVLTQKLAEDSR
jgi:hypothetical protein